MTDRSWFCILLLTALPFGGTEVAAARNIGAPEAESAAPPQPATVSADVAAAQLASLQQVPPDVEQYSFVSPTSTDRIGRITAPVMINGKGPFRMIVDTGANQSVLTHATAAALGIEPTADSAVKLTGVTGWQMVPTITVDSFETGTLSQRDLRLAVMNSVSGGAQGILGMQGFDGKRITVDFANDRIQIADSRGEKAGREFAAIPVKVRFGRLLLTNGYVGGVRVRAVIDTGAERTLGNSVLRDELIRRKRLPAPPTVAGVVGVTNVEQRGDSIWTRRITLGELTITDVNVIYGDMHVFKVWDLEDEPALLVGMDVLGMLDTLIVDYRMKQVQIRVR